jgi:hypothetical protein
MEDNNFFQFFTNEKLVTAFVFWKSKSYLQPCRQD